MSQSSLGLTIGIPPNVAETLRQQPSLSSTTKGPFPSLTNPNGETKNESSSSSSSSSPPLDTTKELPAIAIQIEKLIGYQPSDNEELRTIQLQLVQAMWTRYQQTTSDGSVQVPISQIDHHQPPPPDFDRQVMEFFDTGVARYTETPVDVPREGYLILPYPPCLQCPVTGELISTRKILHHIQQKQPPLEFVTKLWTYLKHCSRPLLWKRDMATELSLLIREEQARLEYQDWTESKRQAKLDNLYSVRETLVHQVEVATTKVERLEELREIQLEEAMVPFRRKICPTTSLETFGSTELAFPDEFQWLGLKGDNILDEDDDWGQDYDSDGEYSNDSREDNDLASDDEYTANQVEDDQDGDLVPGSDDSENDLGARDDNHLSLPTEPPSIDSIPKPLLQAEEKTTLELPNVSTEEHQDTTLPGESAEAKHSLTAAFQRRKKKREKANRRKKEEEKAIKLRAKQQEYKRLEEEMRSKLTSNELILAQTMRNALSEKLEKIEELLDSLQDEVWQAEEEAELQSPNETDRVSESHEHFSLLDQVLAMILGATPMPDEKSPAEHFQFMQSEHQSLVQAWKTHFGRLPPPATATNSAGNLEKELFERPLSSKEHRQLLGISDNDCDDWDAVENWDSMLDDTKKNSHKASRSIPSAQSVPSPSTTATPNLNNEAHTKVETAPPKLVGLRPGGRVVRPKQIEQ